MFVSHVTYFQCFLYLMKCSLLVVRKTSTASQCVGKSKYTLNSMCLRILLGPELGLVSKQLDRMPCLPSECLRSSLSSSFLPAQTGKQRVMTQVAESPVSLWPAWSQLVQNLWVWIKPLK